IPTVVWFSPVLPFINDTKENIDGILDYCIRAGVKAIICFGIGLTLRDGSRDYFYRALDRLASTQSRGFDFAGIKQRYIKTFGNSYIISSPHENELWKHLSDICKKNNIMLGGESIFKWMEEFPESAESSDNPSQLELF
ncbi:MAG: radical SAM protein, partial [Treponema sp.]|nr:radical SAM protein [Treponema sp.]